jgi:hypothetical protein
MRLKIHVTEGKRKRNHVRVRAAAQIAAWRWFFGDTYVIGCDIEKYQLVCDNVKETHQADAAP